MQRREEELRLLLLPRDPNDERNVIVERFEAVSAATRRRFLLPISTACTACMQSAAAGILRSSTSMKRKSAGLKKSAFLVNGHGAYSRLKFESGVHRVQRVPETESGGRIHTSAASVAVLPEADEVEVEINPNDLQIDTYRSSGAGGQHVNKRNPPFAITPYSHGYRRRVPGRTRSQYKNRDPRYEGPCAPSFTKQAGRTEFQNRSRTS